MRLYVRGVALSFGLLLVILLLQKHFRSQRTDLKVGNRRGRARPAMDR